MSDFIDVSGSRLEVRRIPARLPGRPALVFLHEGLGSLGLWKDFPDRAAAATGAEVFVYARHGHGRSAPALGPRNLDYLHREALDILPAVLDAAGLARPLLIGHSDGATIALIYAAEAGRPVAGLILEAAHVFVEDITIAGIREAVKAWQTTDLPARLGRHHDDAKALFEAWSDTWLSPPFRSWSIVDLLPRVQCPVVAIQGEDDEYGTKAQVDTIVEKVSGPAKPLMLPNCGHTPHRDQPDAVLGEISEMVNNPHRIGTSRNP